MTYLSAWRVADTSDRFLKMVREAWVGTPGMQLLPTETTWDGQQTTVFAGNIVRTASGSVKLFYDVEVNVSGTGNARLDFVYGGYQTLSVQFPPGTTGHQWGLLNVTTAPPIVPSVIPISVIATAPASGTVTARLYWLDEIPTLAGYTPLSNVNALANGAISTVDPALNALQSNAVYLRQLLNRRGVAGFRPSEMDFMSGQGSQSSTYRIKSGGYEGYLYVLWGIYAGVYEAGAKVTVTLTANSTTQIGTLTVGQNYGASEHHFIDKIALVDAIYPLSAVTPIPRSQRVLRIDLNAVRTGNIYARITPMFMCWVVDEDTVGDFPMPLPGHIVSDLTSLYLVGRALAADDGTGYGKYGYDLASGMPIGYAAIDGRSQAMTNSRTHSGAYASVINMEKSQYQVISIRHTGAPHLLVKGKEIGIYYLREDPENHTMLLDSIGSVGDATQGELLDISDIPVGVIYIVAADLTQNTVNARGYLDGAWEVYANG